MRRRTWLALPWMWAALACSGSDESQAESQAEAKQSTPEQATELAASEANLCALPGGGYGAACDECLAAQCCAEIEACKAGDDCGRELACIVECQHDDAPTSCSQACVAADGPDPGYTAYDDCSFEKCLSTCWM